MSLGRNADSADVVILALAIIGTVIGILCMGHRVDKLQTRVVTLEAAVVRLTTELPELHKVLHGEKGLLDE